MTSVAREPVRFAMFDWLDESGRGQGETYEERLRLLELADRLGFACYHLAEHHATELSTVPSPNLFLSAVAPRTRRPRLHQRAGARVARHLPRGARGDADGAGDGRAELPGHPPPVSARLHPAAAG